MKPFQHHPKVRQALQKDIPGSIECQSQQEMDLLFREIAEHYGSNVIKKNGREYTALLWPIKGRKSRTARDCGISHRVA